MDLRYIEQIVDTEQTASLSMLLKYAAEHLIDGKRTLSRNCRISDPGIGSEGTGIFQRRFLYPLWVCHAKSPGNLLLLEPLSKTIK